MDAQGGASPRRRYRMSRRLDGVAETKQRITAAAFELHASVGPARTTVAGIAARAGVQRRTVSAHFPDLSSLYEACTDYGIEATGMPDPDHWVSERDPEARLRRGLGDLYGWYGANERLLANVLGDEPEGETGPDAFTRRMIRTFEVLGEVWPEARGRRRFDAVLQHAMAFETWRTLTRGGLTPGEAAELMVDLVARIGGSVATEPVGPPTEGATP